MLRERKREDMRREDRREWQYRREKKKKTQ